MKPYIKPFGILIAIIMLASCAHAPGRTAVPTGASAAAQSQSPSPFPTPTYTPVPVPTADIIPDLPDPALWAAALKLGAGEYPRVDGSTANLPLGIYMRSKITGETLAESAAATRFTTTGPSYIALANGAADLLVVYEAPEEVKKQLDEMKAKLTVEPIGMDALVFLANKGNPVTNLTHDQIVKIYTGKITKWDQVGGEKKEIIPYQRISNSGSQALMLKLVMKDTKIMDAPAILQPGEMGELIDDIASYDNTGNALGYSVYYYVRNMYKVPGVKLLSVDGVAPEPGSIASKRYPYVNAFYAAIREDEPAGSPARKLFDWLTGAEGKRAVEDAGYVAAGK